jgi:hypothetical protein
MWVSASSMVLLHRLLSSVPGLVLWTFRDSRLSEVGSLAPRPNPNPEDQGPHFFWPLPFDLSGMRNATKSLHSCQHSSLGHWAYKFPLHDMAVVLQKRSIVAVIIIIIITIIVGSRRRGKPCQGGGCVNWYWIFRSRLSSSGTLPVPLNL